jgi:predicted small lipoprotein YifL
MKRTMLLVLIAAGLLTGCGEKTPKCSSDDAKNLVVDIARKTIEKGMTLDKDVRLQ